MTIADLIANLNLNSGNFDNGILSAEAMAKKAMNAIQTAFKAAAAVGVAAFVGLGKAAVEYTSDLAELENVLSVTFGERFNAIALNADAMGRAMGRSSLQMRGMVAQAGALGKGLGFVGDDLEQMSLQVAQLSVDVGSFFNISDEEAWNKIRAGITGETEPLKSLGIVMTEANLKTFALQQGIKKLWKDLSEAEKTQIRYNYILEKTSFFAGDAERTINSTANRTKVLQASLGDLYGVVGKNLEPVWNEFLKNLNDAVVAITENEKATLGLASAFEALGKVAGGVTWITKNFILGIQNIAYLIGEPFRQLNVVKDFNKVNNDFKKVTETWKTNNQSFIESVNDQYRIDLQNSSNHSDKLKAEYERKLKILNEYNRTAIDGTKKANDEILRLNNLGAGNMAFGAKPQELGMIKESDYKTVLEMMKTGKLDYSKLSISNIKGINKGYEKAYQDLVRKLVEGAGQFGTAISWLENATALGGPKTVGVTKDVSINTTLKDWVNNINGNTGGGGTTTDTLTATKLKKQYDAEIKALDEYAKQRLMSEEDKQRQLLAINDSYTKQFIDNGWAKEGLKIAQKANKIEATIKANEEPKKLEELKTNYEAEKTAFEEYAKQRQLTEEEKLQGLLSIQNSYSKQAIDNKWIEYGQTLSLEANKTQATIKANEDKKKLEEDKLEEEKRIQEEQKKILDEKIKQGQELIEQDKLILAQGNIKREFEDDKNIQQLNDTYVELNKKYAENEEILKIIDSEYENYLKNLGKEKDTKKDLSKSISDVASLTSELATLFDDDLLGAMSNVLNGISSGIASYASGNILGTITSAVGVLVTVKSFLDNDDLAKKQEEAYETFTTAVENFKKAVDSMTLGQAISFSKLEKPVNLSTGAVSGGKSGITLQESLVSSLFGVNIGAIASLFGKGKSSNASVDTSQLKKLLASSGYENIDVDAIMGKYAQYSEYRNWYGKKKSYISGYDTAGAMAEIQKLIDEAYEQNMQKIKEALGFTHTEFANNMASVFKSGGSISESLNDMFSNALITAFFNQEAFEILNKQMGNALSEAVLGEMSNLGLDMNLTGTFEEQMTQYAEITGASFEILNDIMKKYGITVGKTTDTLSSLETKLPSGFKIALAGYQAINTTVNQGQTIVYQVENNYSKDFQEMVDNANNQSRYRNTGNMRGRGY